MTHLEVIANEEARHGNRDALDKLQRRVDGAINELWSIIASDIPKAAKMQMIDVVLHLENDNG